MLTTCLGPRRRRAQPPRLRSLRGAVRRCTRCVSMRRCSRRHALPPAPPQAEQVQVTWEDQQNINTFSKLNMRRHELEALISGTKVR